MQRLTHLSRFLLFFFLGGFAAALVISSLAYLVFTATLKDRVYPGVKIAGRDVSGLTISDLEASFPESDLSALTILISSEAASVSATGADVNLAHDKKLMSARAYSVGRQTKNPYYNFLQIISAWNGEIDLPIEVSFEHSAINNRLDALSPLVEKPPIDAIFKFVPNIGPDNRGRVQAFQPSRDGVRIDRDRIFTEILSKTKTLAANSQPRGEIIVPLYTQVVSPTIRSTTADDMGIKDLLGKGESYFYDSIPGRVHNIGLATEKVHGRLIAPDEVFSFSESIGTVSAVFGYQKAYAIIKGKTVLDDGGGVCQVSTTVYRTALNAGLPIVERAAHSYRVGFYEQGGFKPGLDATVYPPSPDLKFKNDTGNWILIQTNFDTSTSKLTMEFFGTNDGRRTTLTGPFIVSTSGAPEPIYEDDPTLPPGQVKQVDTAHPGAVVYFTRQVTRNGQVLISETVHSNYVPWPARFLRGTQT